MDLNAINTNVNRLLSNIWAIIAFLSAFTVGSAADVTITYLNADGSESVRTFPNVAKFTYSVIRSIVSASTVKIYVSDTGDDSNDGTEEYPLLTTTKAMSFVPNGGAIELVLLSNMSWVEDVYKNNIKVLVRLNGYALSLVPKVTEEWNYLYAISGSNNTVYFNGGSIDGSQVIMPADATDGEIDGLTGNSCFVKSGGIDAAGGNLVHVSYGVEIIDNDCYGLLQVLNSVGGFSGASFSFSSPSRELGDLIIGKVSDDNGWYKNIQSNLAI